MKRTASLISAVLVAGSMATATVAKDSTPAASPQSAAVASPAALSIPMDQLGTQLMQKNPTALENALKAPIPNKYLPEGYANAVYDEQGLSMLKILQPEATVGYMVPYTPPASVAKVGDTAVRFGYVNYQFFKDPINDAKLADLKSKIQLSLKDNGNDKTTEVTDTTVQGQKAIELVDTQKHDDKLDVTRVVIVPVGNVLVVESTTITGATVVNEQLMKQKSDGLTVAAVQYLADIVAKS